MKRLTIAAAVFVFAALAAGSVEAKGKSVTGAWTLTAEHVSIRLTLRQKKSTVTGTLDWPHGDPIRLAGRFTHGTLTFAGDSGGENFTIHIDSTGTLRSDGTLTGVVKAHFVDFNDAHAVVRQTDQEIPWTAMRGDRSARTRSAN